MALVISDPSSATIARENILWPRDLENTTPVRRKYSHVEPVRIRNHHNPIVEAHLNKSEFQIFTILPLVATVSIADRRVMSIIRAAARLDAPANMTPSGMGHAEFSCLATASRARLNPPLCMEMGLEWSCVTCV